MRKAIQALIERIPHVRRIQQRAARHRAVLHTAKVALENMDAHLVGKGLGGLPIHRGVRTALESVTKELQ